MSLGLRELSIFGSTSAAADCNVPPAKFIQTIKNDKIVKSKSCCFILYSMTQTHMDFQVPLKPPLPFELFKDCYNKNSRRRGSECTLSKYFSTTECEVPPAEDVGDSLDGATIIGLKAQDTSEICIFPQVLLFDKNTSQLRTSQHVEEYRSRFEAVLIDFNAKGWPHLFINWLKLIESYVEFVFRDLTIKWCQWLHSVRAVRHRRSVQMTLGVILPNICKKFWRKYFTFQNSLRQSIGQFSGLLRRLAGDENSISGGRICQSRVAFGLWLDSKNGILIFGNSVYSPVKGSTKDVHVTPNTGICLDQSSPKDTIKKLLLFINLAVVECFMNEIE